MGTESYVRLARLCCVSASGGDSLVREVTSWEGVSTAEGRFGSTRFLLGRRELGHLHPPATLDMPLPPKRKRELVESGDAERHRWTPPDSGWVTIRLADEAAAGRAVALLRERFEHARALTEDRKRPSPEPI